MLNFTIDMETCIACGQCASDCPAMIISMSNNLPVIPEELEQYCIGCMHCVAICSEGSVSILGYGPGDGEKIDKKQLPAPEQMELLIKGRRSTRNYQDRNVDGALISKLVEVASHAPSGHNDRKLLFTLIDDKGVAYDLREKVYAELDQFIESGNLPEGMEMFRDIMAVWKAAEKDIVFRGAPHMLVVSASEDSASPLHDAIIALTTFEMFAASNGIGTIWNGLATLVLSDLLPSFKRTLGIPEDHEIGYVMGFGLPAINFKRTISRGAPAVNRITKI